jgi:hypothetical protein
MSNDYYPAGAENDPNAPYNQVTPDPVNVDVEACYTLSRKATVSTSNYEAEDWDDWDCSDGEVQHIGGTDYDFRNTNFIDEFENDFYTPLELFEELKIRVESELELIPDKSTLTAKRLQRLLKSCENWSIEDKWSEQI